MHLFLGPKIWLPTLSMGLMHVYCVNKRCQSGSTRIRSIMLDPQSRSWIQMAYFGLQGMTESPYLLPHGLTHILDGLRIQ